MLLEQQAWRGDTLLVEGRIRIGCVHATTLKPRRMPDQVENALAAHMDTALAAIKTLATK
jgi:acyl-CoA thioester hydrolase